jgi:hypothetical protein
MTSNESANANAKPLTEQTPVEIDTQLAAVYDDIAVAAAEVRRVEQYLDDYRRGVQRRDAGDSTYRSYTDEGLDQLKAKHTLVRGYLRLEAARTARFDEEFTRRGGWTRAFLVRNAGGHVHSSMSCSTCFDTTVYAWLPEYSGHDEAEIVDAAGEKACTVCFPSAPVDVLNRKSRIEDPAVRAKREERERKAAAKAEKDKLTGIWNPDGTPLKELRSTGYEVEIRTERAADTRAVDLLFNQAVSDEVGRGHNPNYATSLNRIVAALAAKRGQTEEQVLADLTVKTNKKLRRTWPGVQI